MLEPILLLLFYIFVKPFLSIIILSINILITVIVSHSNYELDKSTFLTNDPLKDLS